MNKSIVSPNAPKAVGPYSQAIETGGTLYISGQLPIHVETGLMETADIVLQTRKCLENIEQICISAGYVKEDIVKCTVYMVDLNHFQTMNSVYQEFFGLHKPARVALQIGRLPKDSLIEIDAICHK
ncbi:MAG: hypothetical protein JXB20_03405 [Bacilli bacterium]|nr:hypothetical protein [Bacilli bacterium]MBN2696253.1 hypothetical protein [Bacilli bacterium]